MPLLLRQPRTSQPQGPVGIDWSNPITRGLVYAWIPSTDTLTKSGAPTLTTNVKGVGLATNGSSSYEFSNSAPTFSLDECSVTAILTPIAVANSSSFAVCAGNSGNSNPLFMLGQGATAGQLAFRTRDAAGTDLEVKAAAGAWANGVTSVASGTRSKSAALQRVYSNGSQIGASAVGTASATTFDRFAIGCLLRSSAALFWAGATSFVAIHNRALSAAEVKSLSDNPWQIFAPQSRQIWVPSDVTGAFFTSLIEAATAADASSIVAALSGTASEPGTATDTVNGVGAGSYTGTASESTTATDATSEVFGATGIASESGTATDAADRTLATFASVAESGTATDAASQIAAMSGTVAESTSATDSAAGAGAGAYNGSTAETVSAADTVSQLAALSGSATEAASATDTVTQVAALSVSITESVSATDLASGVKAVQALIAEAITAADAVSAAAAGAYFASLSEDATALDAQSLAAAMFGSLAEAATATDFTAVYKAWVVTIVDNAAANDLISAIVADAIKRLFVTDIAVLTLPSSFTVTDTPSSIVVTGQSSDIYVR